MSFVSFPSWLTDATSESRSTLVVLCQYISEIALVLPEYMHVQKYIHSQWRNIDRQKVFYGLL